MKRTVSLGLFLYALWLLLSGYYTPLLMSFGLVSVGLTLWLASRLKVIDEESHPIHIAGPLLRFWLQLSHRIFVANLDVIARILGVKPISPALIKLPFRHTEDLSKVIYANSITLTPGSASVFIENDVLYVHSISVEGAESLRQGDMAHIIPHRSTVDEDLPS